MLSIIIQPMRNALIFDFDGLILETEGPIYQSWQEVYRSFGQELALELWLTQVGTYHSGFDPNRHLEQLLGGPVDWDAVEEKRCAREQALIAQQPVMPGVVAYLEDTRRLGLKVGLASSSTHAWVDGSLSRLGLLDYFASIRCKEDVPMAKPDPALFLAVLRDLDLQPEQAIVLEDSYNGLLAAQRAGIFAVAVPTDLTRHMDLSIADLRLESLAATPLEDLLRAANSRH